MSTPDGTSEAAKTQLRRRLSAARSAVPAAVRAAEAAALATSLDQCFDPASRSQDQCFDPASRSQDQCFDPASRSQTVTVCAYWPVGSEPGSPELLDRLRRRGCQVLLPVIGAPGGPRAPLNWAEYTGPESLRAGPLGLREPEGPLLGHAAITRAGLVLVPALAVDHRGVRLGRGGGYYDRTLPLATPGTSLIAVVRDDEVLPWLPAEPHDVPVTGVLTPGGGLRPLVSG